MHFSFQHVPQKKKKKKNPAISYLTNLEVIKKVKQSHYRPGVAQSFRKLKFLDYMTTAQDGGKVVSLTYRPPLPPGNAAGTHFC